MSSTVTRWMPLRPADPHAVAAQERGEAPLNVFSANKIMRDFGAVIGTASKKNHCERRAGTPRVMGGYSGPGEALAIPNPSVVSSVL